MRNFHYAQKDSERFGLIIFRAKEDGIDGSKMMRQILDNNVDTAIIRIKTELLSEIHHLDKTAMPFQITDTLAYYNFDLNTYRKQALINRNLTFAEAKKDDWPKLEEVVKATFNQYVNHYRMNPFMDNDAVTEGYKDWVRRYIDVKDKKCWVVKDNEKLVAFGTFHLGNKEHIKSILCGVLPEYRNRGIFHDLLTCAKNFGKEQGKAKVKTICQIENIAVQRILTQQGFELHHTENTIHINSMLTKSVFSPIETLFQLADRDSFEHSLNQIILKEINQQFDKKQNIKTINHRFVNIEPLKSYTTYTMLFTFPLGNKVLLRVFDKDRNTYMLVYFDLK